MTPAPAPMSPTDADAFEAYWNWPIDWWWDWITPNYDDVAEEE